jgi:hypothetical protein
MLDPDEPLSGQLARLRADSADTPRSVAGGRVADSRRPSAEPDRWAVDAPAGRGPSPQWPSAEQRRDHVGRRRARRLLVSAGLVVILLLVAIAAWSGWFGGGSTPPTAPPGTSAPAASAPATPLIDAQEYRERGIAVNVPKAWARSGSGSYVDFTDPASARWVRINIEQTSATAMQFLKNAETGLKNPSRCPAPFVEVGLREAELAGQPGAELEYTCGTGDGMRHGIWRAVVVDGTAYHFYLTVPDSRFAESKIIFDEMVRSFQFATA